MHFHISGSNIPIQLFELISALTDHSKICYSEIKYDEAEGVVRIPVTRYPLLKQRRALGNVHDKEYPISSTIIIQHVISFDEDDNVPPELGEEVQLFFGIKISENKISLYSAEETLGVTSYSLVINVSEYDIEVIDEK